MEKGSHGASALTRRAGAEKVDSPSATVTVSRPKASNSSGKASISGTATGTPPAGGASPVAQVTQRS